ncbi:hypothetical protein FAM09_27730 [Niastella caeni]|uniref:Uncharacterized protein n=1 Tax=Niastella caeni TaxID=2569763 RepID=A0A4S8HAL7_9BACT|nr:hypothetical protein [Niastella caeni]THU31978.1 hypothetical protein FAM09_27730 [Niastella caeni]
MISKHKDKGLWVLFFFNFYSFLTNLLIINGWNNFIGLNIYFLYRLFTILGYSLVALFFYKNISSVLTKRLIIITYILLFLYATYDYIISPPKSFDSIPSSIEAIFIIISAILYLFEQIKKPRVLFIYTLDKFWVVASLLIYYTGTFFLFISAEAYFGDPDFGKNYILINNSFLLLKNIVFSIGLLLKDRSDKFSPGTYTGFESYLEKHF